MQQEIIKVKTESINKVMKYLGKRPFEEVHSLINELQYSLMELNKPEPSQEETNHQEETK